jgi:hypothetical protein
MAIAGPITILVFNNMSTFRETGGTSAGHRFPAPIELGG